MADHGRGSWGRLGRGVRRSFGPQEGDPKSQKDRHEAAYHESPSRDRQELAGSRAGGLHSRTIEVLDQRGIADLILSQGELHKVVHFHVPLDISDFPTRHNFVLGLRQNHIERILADGSAS